MAVKLETLCALGVDLRAAVAEKLGCPVEAIPAEKAPTIAKSLDLAPVVNVVDYTTARTNKRGIYLVSDAIQGFGRDAGKVFHRLGNPDDSATGETVETMRTLAKALRQRAADLESLADSCESELDND